MLLDFFLLDSSGPILFFGRQSSLVFVFVLSLEDIGVRKYCSMAGENRLAALCLACSPRATRGARATNPRPGGLVAWWCCA